MAQAPADAAEPPAALPGALQLQLRPAPAAPDESQRSLMRERRSTLLGGHAVTTAEADAAGLCGAREDLPLSDWLADPALRYDPEVYLLGALREAYDVAVKWQVPTQLDCAAGRIVVHASCNRLQLDFSVERLEALHAQPLGRRPKTRTLSRAETVQLQERLQQGDEIGLRLDDMFWRGALLTAAGRLPSDFDPQRRLYLLGWPNLTRLSATPHAVRIAALWCTRGASLLETAEMLHIPQRDVIGFYNGVRALGLVTDDGSHIRQGKRRGGRNRGLLTRLLGWLHA